MVVAAGLAPCSSRARRGSAAGLPVLLALLAVAPLVQAGAGAARPLPTLALDDAAESATYGSFEARGLDSATLERLRAADPSYAEWLEIFAVYAGDPADGRPPVLGTYAVEGDRVRFIPRFATAPGLTYTARWLDPFVEARLGLPPADEPPTTVVAAVYPSADEVPENLLKLYLHFSRPMSRGEADAHIRLIREDGAEIEAPFVAPEVELWNRAGDRLTLFFDPGRIKRGLEPHEQLGAPLVAGESFRLLVDAGWRDAAGRPLAAPFEKRYRVGAADRASPEPADWTVLAPADPGQPLELHFPEPLDSALLGSRIQVLGPGGSLLSGGVEIGEGETVWRFRPEARWQAGDYRLRIAGDLEDLAGNSPRRLFDVEALESEPRRGAPGEAVFLGFSVE